MMNPVNVKIALPASRSATILDIASRKELSQEEALLRTLPVNNPTQQRGLFAAARRVALCGALYLVSIIVRKLNG